MSRLTAAAHRLGIRRRHLADARVRCERTFIPALTKRRSAPNGRVLCYHSVGTPEWGVNDVPARRFRQQLETALALGYRFVPANAIATGEAGEKDVAVTFDDGLLSVLRNASPILKDLGIASTLFVVCDWADGKHATPELFMGWAELEQLAISGAVIGSHSMTHPDFGKLGIDQAEEELQESRRVIRERIGIEVDSFAIPFGQSSNWRPEFSRLAHDTGYRNVFAQAVATRVDGTVPRTFVTRYDDNRIFRAALTGAFDSWEEPL